MRENNSEEDPVSMTITMMLFLVWHVQMQDFQRPKVKTGLIPHFIIREKMKGL